MGGRIGYDENPGRPVKYVFGSHLDSGAKVIIFNESKMFTDIIF